MNKSCRQRKLAAVAASAVALGVLAGCAPLQQAALMYASKAAVGLDVAVGTTDTPGGSVTIGFKMVDAAYVPVAVAKERKDGQKEGSREFEIVRVEAQFGEGSAATQLEQLSEVDKEKLKLYLEAKVGEERAQAAFARADAELKRDEAAKARLQERLLEAQALVQKQPASASDAVKKKNAEEVDRLNSDLAKKTAEVNEGRQLRDQRATALRDATELRSQRQREAQDAIAGLRTDKHDALSVYGRFNAEGAGSAASSPSAKLTSGKIFSTGVASQNLTEAVKVESAAVARTQCLDSVTALLKTLAEAERPKFLESLRSICVHGGR